MILETFLSLIYNASYTLGIPSHGWTDCHVAQECGNGGGWFMTYNLSVYIVPKYQVLRQIEVYQTFNA
jgi:hypothetical protein